MAAVVGRGAEHQGRRHAGAAPPARGRGRPEHGDHRRLGLRPARRRCWTASASAWCPCQLIIGDRVYQDRIEMSPQEFYAVLREGRCHPTTSQPPPAAFTAAYEHARASADEVVAVVLSSGLCGTYANALAARARVRAGRGARGGQPQRLVRRSGCSRCGAPSWRRTAGRGRTSPGSWSGCAASRGCSSPWTRWRTCSAPAACPGSRRSWPAVLDLKPILTLDARGEGHPGGPGAGPRGAARRACCGLVERALPPVRQRLRFGVAHVDCPEVADAVRAALVAAVRPARGCSSRPATRRARDPRRPRRLGGLLAGGGRDPGAAREQTGRSGRYEGIEPARRPPAARRAPGRRRRPGRGGGGVRRPQGGGRRGARPARRSPTRPTSS